MNSNARIVFKKFLAFESLMACKNSSALTTTSNDALNVDKASARALHRVSQCSQLPSLAHFLPCLRRLRKHLFELILTFCWVRKCKSNFLDFWHHVLYDAIIAAMDNTEIQCMWLAMNVSSIRMHLGHFCLYALTDTWHIGCSVIALPPEFTIGRVNFVILKCLQQWICNDFTCCPTRGLLKSQEFFIYFNISVLFPVYLPDLDTYLLKCCSVSGLISQKRKTLCSVTLCNYDISHSLST